MYKLQNICRRTRQDPVEHETNNYKSYGNSKAISHFCSTFESYCLKSCSIVYFSSFKLQRVRKLFVHSKKAIVPIKINIYCIGNTGQHFFSFTMTK